MRYISEEKIIELITELTRLKHPDMGDIAMHLRDQSIDTLKMVISECRELNQWQPIDENTPRDRRILLLYEDGAVRVDWWHHESQQDNKIVAWIELPEPPK